MISSTLLTIALAALSVNALPRPQGETRLLPPTNGPVPAGCSMTYNGFFAIAAVPATDVPIPATLAKRQGQLGDGQVTVPVATQITDAQPQAPTATVPAVTQISDAQPQAPGYVSTMMHTAVSQIHDGQVQAYYTVPVVTQISDAQPQAPVVTPVTQISDAQPQAPANPVTQITDAQPQAPVSSAHPITQGTDAQPAGTTAQAAATNANPPAPSVSMVACATDNTLEMSISNGRLVDNKGRIGYIAANYQFQFDAGVPQTGAIITTGFTTCDDGHFGLGGSQIWWRCLSGTFYNLYDRYWAPQCEPVYLEIVGLKQC